MGLVVTTWLLLQAWPPCIHPPHHHSRTVSGNREKNVEKVGCVPINKKDLWTCIKEKSRWECKQGKSGLGGREAIDVM